MDTDAIAPNIDRKQGGKQDNRHNQKNKRCSLRPVLSSTMGTTPRPNMTETSSANQGSFMGTRMSKPEQRSTQEAFLQGKNETPIQDEMMMSVKRLSSLEVVYKVGIFAAVVGTGKFLLPVLLSLENVSDKFIEKAQSWDWGTVLAALVGVCGYIIDSRNHRQAEIRQLHIDRAQNQMNSLLVPINIAFHGLLFGFYGFVDSHMDDFDLDEPVLGGNNPPPTKHQWSSSDKINVRHGTHDLWEGYASSFCIIHNYTLAHSYLPYRA
jgi:hypothetical protein